MQSMTLEKLPLKGIILFDYRSCLQFMWNCAEYMFHLEYDITGTTTEGTTPEAKYYAWYITDIQ